MAQCTPRLGAAGEHVGAGHAEPIEQRDHVTRHGAALIRGGGGGFAELAVAAHVGHQDPESGVDQAAHHAGPGRGIDLKGAGARHRHRRHHDQDPFRGAEVGEAVRQVTVQQQGDGATGTGVVIVDQVPSNDGNSWRVSGDMGSAFLEAVGLGS